MIFILVNCLLEHKAVAFMTRGGYNSALNRFENPAALVFHMSAGGESAFAEIRHEFPESEGKILGNNILAVLGYDRSKTRCIRNIAAVHLKELAVAGGVPSR